MDLQVVVSGTQENRVEALRQILDYPLKQRDPGGSRFWFLRPGADADEAADTCPIAVGFYSELAGQTHDEIKRFVTADQQQREIGGHYTGRIMPNQPVMYLLLPEPPLTPNPTPRAGEGGKIAMILPTDGKLRQRQIQTFSWSDEDLQARLNRLRQDTLARTHRMKEAALSVIPLVEWAFYQPITTAKELAEKLAAVSRRIEQVIPDVYRAEPNDGYLHRLLRSFQQELLPTLKLEPENEKDYSFADIYAQTIAYGLFTARVFSYTLHDRRNALTPSPSPRGGEGSVALTPSPSPRGGEGSVALTPSPSPRGGEGSVALTPSPSPRGGEGSVALTPSPSPRGGEGSVALTPSPSPRGGEGSVALTPSPSPRGGEGSVALTPSPSPRGGEGSLETDFNREDAWECLPETNPFLKRLFKDVSQQPIAQLGEELADAIAEVVSILRAAKMDAILEDFRAKMNREDIVIRFYEDFLAAYKPQMRERRGVYYTPEPVVSYMVRSVDILLKEKFNKPLGLADPEVMILDPACGTGTFLLWLFQLIHQRFQENPEALTEGLEDRSWSGYVKERLLPRIFGFELLMAPYAICHLKLGLFLEETGYCFDGGKRLGVYLTNTLDEALQKSESLFEEFIAAESNQAAAIKRDKPIMIVLGNPPYSVNSANKSEWVTRLVRDAYYPKDAMKEQNPKMLLDDYVKFIRFGQWRIDQTQQGILAFITNHGYLDNPTFRGMRRSLEQSFDEIYVMDLHGNTKKKEVAPDGSKDENVFDIQQGVSICMLLKTKEIRQ